MPDQLPNQPDFEKLEKDIDKFLTVYKVLSPEGKAQFEAQLNGQLKNVDEKTKKLYYVLLESAKNFDTKENAITAMRKISGE